MSFLVDTCFISELRKPSPQQSVLNWLNAIIESELYISSLSIGELQYGIALLPDGNKKKDLTTWLDLVVKGFDSRVLPVHNDVCVVWGKMRANAQKKGLNLSVIDGLLAATCAVYKLTFVTRNTKDVDFTGIGIVSPWDD